MDQSLTLGFRGLPERLLKGTQAPLDRERSQQIISHDLTRESVRDERRVAKARQGLNVRDVGHKDLVGTSGAVASAALAVEEQVPGHLEAMP